MSNETEDPNRMCQSCYPRGEGDFSCDKCFPPNTEDLTQWFADAVAGLMTSKPLPPKGTSYYTIPRPPGDSPTLRRVYMQLTKLESELRRARTETPDA